MFASLCRSSSLAFFWAFFWAFFPSLIQPFSVSWQSLAIPALTALGADDVKSVEPQPKARGKVYEWKSEDGLVYRYRVPEKYDPELGANLTFILHGSNMDRRWGFANHSSKTFRPDDIVVSPDGTTSNGNGGFNFIGNAENSARLHQLHQELRETFRIRATYLYGHSQGSFFAFHYAGEYPKDVQGVVGHASGVWTWTNQSRKGHHQAIVLMHGTDDPVVSYAQSVGGYQSFDRAKYPLLRLRSLEGWNHWPAEHNGPVPHTSQQLAWCEGMTTEEGSRLEAAFDTLSEIKDKKRHDFAALYSLSIRLVDHESASDKLKKRAKKAIKVVEDLADMHAEAIEVPKKMEGPGSWSRHASLFMRSFAGVPRCEELHDAMAKNLEKHKKAGIKELKKYYSAKRGGDVAEAFVAGVAALRTGFLYFECEGGAFLNQLEEWRKDAKKHKIPKKAAQAYDSLGVSASVKKGSDAFDKINKKASKI